MTYFRKSSLVQLIFEVVTVNGMVSWSTVLCFGIIMMHEMQQISMVIVSSYGIQSICKRSLISGVFKKVLRRFPGDPV